MKHILQFILCCFAFTVSHIGVRAESIVIGAIRYHINTQTGTATITQPWYPEGDYIEEAIIPEKISYKGNDYIVVELEDGAFYGCKNLTKVVLPNTIQSVGDQCFRYCEKLVDVSLPDNLPYLSESMFDSCSSLEEITLPPHITIIPEFCFAKCERLKSLIIPEGVIEVRSQALEYTYRLSEITIPTSLTYWGTDVDRGDIRINISNLDAFLKIDTSGYFPGMNTRYELYLNDTPVENIVMPVGATSTKIVANCGTIVSIELSNTIKNAVFRDRNESLESISINSTIKNVDIGGLENLKTVKCYAADPPTQCYEENKWISISKWAVKEATLHVPVGAKSAYEASEEWSKFGTIIDDLTGDSGIDDILDNNADFETEYFNLKGIKINPANLSPGIYIQRYGKTINKILVK